VPSRIPLTEITDAEMRSRDFHTSKQEMTMQNAILSTLVVALAGVLMAQTAAASERHQARSRERAVAIKQFRDSNAYMAPAPIAAQPYWAGYDGAAGSGTAGH
jgi:hypothetical protein